MIINKLSYGSKIEYNKEIYQIYSLFPIFSDIENHNYYYMQLVNLKDIQKSIEIELYDFEIEKEIKIIET